MKRVRLRRHAFQDEPVSLFPLVDPTGLMMQLRLAQDEGRRRAGPASAPS